MLRLRCLAEGDDRVFPLSGDEVRIGRGSDNEIVLADFSVSRRHAALRREGDAWFVYDLMSTNGVQVNRMTVKKSPLSVGDHLKVGIFELEVEGEPEAETPPPATTRTGGELASATIIRRLADFSADYGLEDAPRAESGARLDKRKQLDQAYASRVFGFLTRFGRLLSKAESIDEVLGKVVDIAFEALPVDRGFILLRDDDSGETVCQLARTGEKIEVRPESEVPVSRTMLEAVMRERVALLTYDAQADSRLVGGDSIRIHQIRAAMCAPLWSGERIIGVMQMDSPFHTGTFNEDDLDLFTALANFAAVAVERIRNAERAAFERQVRSRLERYHSPAVIEEVLREGDAAVAEEGFHRLRNTELSVLFADVVGFTSVSESASPEEMANLLSGYFTQSVEAIFAEGGTLDKFIGDCVMAFFGAPMAQPDHAKRAVRAAVRIQRNLARWNEERRSVGQPPVLCRIGINSGPVVVGDVGSDRRVDYTVLGNTVNVAARLEALVAAGGEIVVGDETFRQLGGELCSEPLVDRQLKGLQQRIAAHRILWQE